MRGPLRLRTVIPVALAALALPATAAAHGRTATIALDYRLALDRSTRDLPGVHVRILDGDRDFQIRVDRGHDPARARLAERAAPPHRRERGLGQRRLPDRDRRQDRLRLQARLGPPERRPHGHLARPPALAAAGEHGRPGRPVRRSRSRSTASRPRSRAPSSGSPARAVWPWLLGALVARGRDPRRDPAPPAAGAADDRSRRRRRSRRARRGDDVRRLAMRRPAASPGSRS